MDLKAEQNNGHELIFSDILSGNQKWFRFWENANHPGETDYIDYIGEKEEEASKQIQAIRHQVQKDLQAVGRHSPEEENRLVEAYQKARRIPSLEAISALRTLALAHAETIRTKEGKWKIPKKYQAVITREMILENLRKAEPRPEKKVFDPPAPPKLNLPAPEPEPKAELAPPPSKLDLRLKELGISREDHEALKQHWSINALTSEGQKTLYFYLDTLGFDLRHEEDREACNAWAKAISKDERSRKSAARPKRVLPEHGVGFDLKKIVKKGNQRPVPAIAGDHAGIAQ
jgi:hypothetical protein